MDLWDLTKLLFRRWIVAVPMLVVTAAAVTGLAVTVEPDYKATGYLQLIPPAVSPEDAAKTGRARNPWSTLGVEALGQASVIKVQDQRVLKQMKIAGFSDNFTITMDYNSPIFTIEAVAATPDRAVGTVKEIIRRLDEAVKGQQQNYHVATEDSITTLSLNEVNVETETLKVKRALIVTAGIGLLLTAAASIGVDTLLRRRARRDVNPTNADPSPSATATAGLGLDGPPGKGAERVNGQSFTASAAADTSAVAPQSPAVSAVSREQPKGTLFQAVSAAESDEPADGSSHKSQPEANGQGESRTKKSRPKSLIGVEYQSAGQTTDRPISVKAAEGGERQLSEQVEAWVEKPDATIVLPMAGKSWMAGENKSNHR